MYITTHILYAHLHNIVTTRVHTYQHVYIRIVTVCDAVWLIRSLPRLSEEGQCEAQWTRLEVIEMCVFH
jgi:hypothetical protein